MELHDGLELLKEDFAHEDLALSTRVEELWLFLNKESDLNTSSSEEN